MQRYVEARVFGVVNRLRHSTTTWRRFTVPLSLFVLALAVRWPYLNIIPAPTDETDELLWSFAILRSGARPLTASDPYIGPLASYATAAAFALAGPSLTSGRLVAALFGALAAPATWLLAARLTSRVGAATAGLVMAVAFGPVIHSHIAWSHGSAPALLALGLAALVASVQEEPIAARRYTVGPRRALAFAAGLFLALAVGAHPTVLALLPGIGWWWLWRTRPMSRAAICQLAWLAAGGCAGYAPGLMAIARFGLLPWRAALADREYAAFSAGQLPARVAVWVASLLRNLAGGPQHDAGDPRLWFYGLLLFLALRTSVWRRAIPWLGQAWLAGRRLPIADRPAGVRPPDDGGDLVGTLLISAALFMPLCMSGDRFISLTGLRYSAPLLPPAALALGTLATRCHGPRVWLLWLSLFGVPVASLAAYYRSTAEGGVTGAPILQVVETIVRERGCTNQWAGPPVLIDTALEVKLGGGGEVGRAVAALLTLGGVPNEKARPDKIRWFVLNAEERLDLVLSANTVATLNDGGQLRPRLIVPVVAGQVSRSGPMWGWYVRPARDRSSLGMVRSPRRW